MLLQGKNAAQVDNDSSSVTLTPVPLIGQGNTIYGQNILLFYNVIGGGNIS